MNSDFEKIERFFLILTLFALGLCVILSLGCAKVSTQPHVTVAWVEYDSLDDVGETLSAARKFCSPNKMLVTKVKAPVITFICKGDL